MAEGTLTADVRTASTEGAPFAHARPVRVPRWRSERFRFGLVAIASTLLWLALLASVLGFAAALVGTLAVRLAFLARIRGSGLRLGPEQLPELHQRVAELSKRSGLRKLPEAYLLRSRSPLDVAAMRLLSPPIVVLYSDLLESCEGDEAARDMILGREIGRLRSRPRWSWLLAPSLFVPFLGSAYARARELTCDRWGMVLCGHRHAAIRGLTLLAAGSQAARVNREAFVAQSRDLTSGSMTLGRWLSPTPPLCDRLAELDPRLVGQKPRRALGAARAVAILVGTVALPPLAILALFATLFPPQFTAGVERLTALATPDVGPIEEAPSVTEFERARAQAEADLAALLSTLADHVAVTGELPVELEEVQTSWEQSQRRPFPVDPFDGFPYGYSVDASEVLLWSAGPDGESLTHDDIRIRRRLIAGP